MDKKTIRIVFSIAICFGLSACNLTVEIDGDIGGSVTSSDGFIDCPEVSCKYDYKNTGEVVTLTAVEDQGYTFVGFDDADKKCINGEDDAFISGTCIVAVGSTKKITAKFYFEGEVGCISPAQQSPVDFGALGLDVYADSAWSCLQRDDTSYQLFHGCIDWHSAVHAHWAVLRASNHQQTISPEADSILARLQSSALDDERAYMMSRPSFEMPYGRSWFLALAIEYERLVDDGAVEAMADDMASSLREYLSNRVIDPRIREYKNHTWALTQLLRFYKHRNDGEGESWVNAQVDAYYLTYDSQVNLAIDFTRSDFFSLWGNWAHLLGLRDPLALESWLDQQVISDADLQVITSTSSAHQLGMNPSRVWGLSWAAQVSDDPRFKTAISEHVTEIEKTHINSSSNYGAYGHWVPQFATYALSQSMTCKEI